ncbi:DUF5131 family protein [Streptomyces brasiliscabiei]|uniref:DUF5131 family protein n=1 Tax=Streptomyces brasiliscabiei TaxID=2736302 RepID=UPI001C1241F8|nr:phage Gp37/Gp68 family protein [Streptomyces brasiliscabiei]
MGDNTGIEWTDATFNPWWGCSRISPACRNCYAADTARRWGHDVFHLRGERRMLSDAYWRTPLKWNRTAQQSGTPTRVFCASMADVFEDHPQVTEARDRLWQLIEQTPWLRWQLLTKRPENIAAMAPWGDTWPDHVWIGTSVENQRYAEERIPHLLKINAPVRFLSCEPLVEQISLQPYLADVTTGAGIHWVIAGGESGAKARPMNPTWARALRDQCDAAGTSYFFKQWGEWAPSGRIAIGGSQRGHALVGDPVDELGHRVEMVRVGKKKAGRRLDGRLHDAVPPLSTARATASEA